MAHLFHIDAFTRKAFGGAPAPVIVTQAPLQLSLALAIAAEFNQSILTLLHPGAENCAVHFYDTKGEVGLVGHAGLAAGFVALTRLYPDRDAIVLKSPVGGDLPVRRADELITLEFSATPARKTESIQYLDEMLGGIPVVERLTAPFGAVAVLADEDAVRNLQPDLERALDVLGDTVIVTAPGYKSDFVSRVFAPKFDLPEDPVCGTAHRILVPYWAERLGRNQLSAHQVSAREGYFACECNGSLVSLGGDATVLYEGMIALPGETWDAVDGEIV